jgi:hypothetical protein
LLHGSGFYAGRLIRIGLVALGMAGLLFALWAPLSQLAETRAKEAVSETAALAWSFARYAVLLLGLGVVHMVSSYAKVILVIEDRPSALLAFLSGASLVARHLGSAVAQYLGIAFAGGALLAAWAVVEWAFEPTGFRSQILFFVAAEAFLAARIGLRLWLLASQVALYRGATARAAPL